MLKILLFSWRVLFGLGEAASFILGNTARDCANYARIAWSALNRELEVYWSNLAWELQQNKVKKQQFACNVIASSHVGMDGEKFLTDLIEKRNHDRYIRNMTKARKAADDYAKAMPHKKLAELKALDDVPSLRQLSRSMWGRVSRQGVI